MQAPIQNLNRIFADCFFKAEAGNKPVVVFNFRCQGQRPKGCSFSKPILLPDFYGFRDNYSTWNWSVIICEHFRFEDNLKQQRSDFSSLCISKIYSIVWSIYVLLKMYSHPFASVNIFKCNEFISKNV